MTFDAAYLTELIGRRILLRGQFVGPVTLDGVEDLGGTFSLRVRLPDGALRETVLDVEELSDDTSFEVLGEAVNLVDGGHLFDLVEAQRIEHAYAHDPNFAVSMSGVRGLPHQIEAVYRRMLPQPRLRFVLADDPGAGKTIMAGLLIKELRLRLVADRVLILCPAPLTVQWQDELHDKFDERFTWIDSHLVKWQLGQSPWQEQDRCIASIDFAKRDEVLPDLLRAEWDLVVIDEAHKCSAASYPKGRDGGDELDRTKRYTLAEELSRRCERLLLMTATPHSGDRSRFHNFLRLLDPDQFAVDELAAEQIRRDDSPYFLRREKDDLVDEYGGKLFVEREVLTQPFELGTAESALYVAVTEYIQHFLGPAGGGRGNAVALARTVLQRRLASSLGAIRSSLRKRADRIGARLLELEALPPAERVKRLRELKLAEPLIDAEQDPDDATEDEEDFAAEGVVVAESLEQMRTEIAALEQLVVQADRTIAGGEEAKLGALRDCLQNAELAELTEDGRGKLLIFTEHRDTLAYLERNLREWGYTTCAIHGGLPPTQRKEVQQDFHQSRQICIATEAAGEGINLQFCHLMINYDLPWNPVRLEQRMGRIHRIGQLSKCVVFNFCATNTVEGKLLRRLLEKLELMRVDLGDKVYDVVGQVLAQGGLDFERLLRDAMIAPERVDAAEREIIALDPGAYAAYERDIGIAQATKSVDVSWVRKRDWRSEERRLMPEFVERLFGRAAEHVGLRLEDRRDGEHLLRVEHVPRSLKDDRLLSVRRLGPPQDRYLKMTFYKEARATAQHEDAVLLSPGHPLYGASIERMRDVLRGTDGGVAPFVAPWAREAYAIHFFTFVIQGMDLRGQPEHAWAELVAVVEEADGAQLVSPDVLHDLTPIDYVPRALEEPDPAALRRAANHVRSVVQKDKRRDVSNERADQARLRSDYLRQAMDAQREALQQRYEMLEDRVYRGEDAARLARDRAEAALSDLERLHGMTRFRDLFTPRQLATLCAFAQGVREAHDDMVAAGMEPQRAEAVATYLATVLSRVADASSTVVRWVPQGTFTTNTFARQALPMVWDFAETNPFSGAVGDAARYVENNSDILEALAGAARRVECHRTSATQLPDHDGTFDAVITDPPYYDNISYADLSDFFYVWLKRSIGFLFEDEFGGELTPKRREAIMASYRHGGDKRAARAFYEQEMAEAFAEAHRVLKPSAPLVCVYAHKTTLGWAALVEALRRARFTITEAWPLDTENPERAIGQGTASLASSIFLVARRRDNESIGAYHEVVAELDDVIEERLERLTRAGVSGSDLVIATIGAALRPFTQHASVELPSGEPVGAESFLTDVQTRVLDAVLGKVHNLGAEVGGIDAATRYYVLARTMFGWADIEFDEANNLARTAGVELKDALASGPHPLADITGKAVHLRDFEERGSVPDLGLSGTPLLDVLHGVLWRANHRVGDLPDYLTRVRPDADRLRAVTQALQGKALRDEGESKPPEAQACERLLGSWRNLVERNLEARL